VLRCDGFVKLGFNCINMNQIVIDENIRFGKPVIYGTRITVEEVLGALAGGMTFEGIEEEYGVQKEGIILMRQKGQSQLIWWF
jgi:uncharacterized protein (DUF433 family)